MKFLIARYYHRCRTCAVWLLLATVIFPATANNQSPRLEIAPAPTPPLIDIAEFPNSNKSAQISVDTLTDNKHRKLSGQAPPPLSPHHRDPLPEAGETPEVLDNPLPSPIKAGSFRLELEEISSALTAPLWGLPAPGVSDRFFLIEQTGELWSIDSVTGNTELVANFNGRLVNAGTAAFSGFDERGLLGLAFHPNFANNGLLYTYTSEPAEDTADFTTLSSGEQADHQSVITQWQTSTEVDGRMTLDFDSAVVLMRIDQPQFNHNGGHIAFGPDGMLYIALGDGGGADDDHSRGHGIIGNGQDTTTLLGSLLRIDPAGRNSENGRYGIPEDNPLSNQPGLDEIYAYGLRNPYRFSFDPQNGDLIVTDVGQNAIEEINRVKSGDNLGWNAREGSFGFFSNDNQPGFVFEQPQPSLLVDPIAQYDHDEGIAIIGGFTYRHNTAQQAGLEPIASEFDGRYVFGDFTGRLFYLTEKETIAEFRLLDNIDIGVLLGFAQDATGNLYLLASQLGSTAGHSGSVYRMIITANQPPIVAVSETQSPPPGAMVQLDASNSIDPDNDPLSFEWQQISGPPVALDDNTTATPSFTTPTLNTSATLVFRVTVNDGHHSNTAEISIRVDAPPPPQPPPTTASSSGGTLCWLLVLLALFATGRRQGCFV